MLFGISQRYTPARAGTAIEGYSVARAMRDVAAIAREPHPHGTPAEARVAAYLAAQLQSAGLTPEIEDSWYTERVRNREYAVIHVKNIVAKVQAGTSGRAVLFVAHYDSAPSSPGAADDGAGAATLLETVRLLKASGDSLKRDIWFLFTDGEELGLLGAKAFVKARPDLSKEVAAVVNFDTRGDSGPVVMFETGVTGDALVPKFLAAVPHPYTTSLASTVYRMLPNNTDFSVFRNAGIGGLNFAFLDDWPGYHSAMDEPSRLSEISLQHMGESAISLARTLGGATTIPQASSKLVYFNLAGSYAVHYPISWGSWASQISLIGFIGVAGVGLWRKAIGIRGLLAGGVSAIAAMLLAPFASTVLLVALFSANGASLYKSGADAGIVVLMAAAVALFAARYAIQRFDALSVAMGGLTIWVLLAFWTNRRAPGATYVLDWPLLAALLCCAPMVFAGRRMWRVSSIPAVILCSVAPLILAPMLKMVGSALIGTGVAAISVPVSLGVFAMLPWVALAKTRIDWKAPAGLACVAVLAAVGLGAGVRYDARNRKSDSVFYVEDVNQKTASWALAARSDDAWTSKLPRGGTQSLAGFPDWFSAGTSFPIVRSAPFWILPAPDVANMQVADGVTRFRVKSPGQSPIVAIHLSADAPFRNVAVEGQELQTGRETEFTILHYGPANDGIPIQFANAKPAAIEVVERYYELPREAGLAARPAWLMPNRNVGDGIVVVRSFGTAALQ